MGSNEIGADVCVDVGWEASPVCEPPEGGHKVVCAQVLIDLKVNMNLVARQMNRHTYAFVLGDLL